MNFIFAPLPPPVLPFKILLCRRTNRVMHDNSSRVFKMKFWWGSVARLQPLWRERLNKKQQQTPKTNQQNLSKATNRYSSERIYYKLLHCKFSLPF